MAYRKDLERNAAAMMKIKNPVKGISSFSSANDPMMKINIVKNIGKKEIIQQKSNPETKFKSTEGTRFEPTHGTQFKPTSGT